LQHINIQWVSFNKRIVIRSIFLTKKNLDKVSLVHRDEEVVDERAPSVLLSSDNRVDVTDNRYGYNNCLL